MKLQAAGENRDGQPLRITSGEREDCLVLKTVTPDRIIWCGTQAEASKTRTAIKRDPDKELEGYDQVDVPTDKAGLLEWLNKNANIDRF